MKQGTAIIREALTHGLRRFSHAPRNSPGMFELHNLAPAEQGLEPHEEITPINESGVSWGGEGKYTASSTTRTITIRVTDYVSDAELESVTVYLDGILKGTTDANGELDIASVTVGGHELKLTKAGYTDSDADNLFNDYIMVV